MVGFGIGALVAYNFIQRNRPFQTKLNQKEMTVTFLQFSGTTWLQEATDDLASQAMLSLLLAMHGRFDWLFRPISGSW